MRYQATVQIGALRLYTREHSEIETAIQHQIVLVQIRNALASESAADSGFWLDSRRASQVCTDVLASFGTSEEWLCLRAWVRMKCNRWLGSSHCISSPVASLAMALEWHAVLLRARATSWPSFRAEAIRITRLKKRVSLAEAYAHVDKARSTALEERLMKALQDVERALTRGRTPRLARPEVTMTAAKRMRGHQCQDLWPVSRIA